MCAPSATKGLQGIRNQALVIAFQELLVSPNIVWQYYVDNRVTRLLRVERAVLGIQCLHPNKFPDSQTSSNKDRHSSCTWEYVAVE